MATKKIMIVEDNELNMKLFREIVVGLLGEEAIELTSGINAVATAASEKPDLILMDIQLPGISGLEIIKQLKSDENLAQIPVIAVTAFAMKNEEEYIRKSGCEEYLSKPISIAHFLPLLKSFLYKSVAS